MHRIAKLVAVAVPLILVAPGCSSKCSGPDECAPGEVCYKGVCQSGINPKLRCAVDEHCSDSSPNPFACVGGQCVIKTHTVVTPDSGIHPDALTSDLGFIDTGSPVDSGSTPDSGPRPDTGVPDLGLVADAEPVDTGAVVDSGVSADAAEPPDSGAFADAAEPPDSGEAPDSGVFADAAEPPDSGEAPDSGVHPDAEPADSGFFPDVDLPDVDLLDGALPDI